MDVSAAGGDAALAKEMQRQVKASQAKKQTLKDLKLKALRLEEDKNRWRDKFQEKEQKL